MITYCIDTNAILDMCYRYYPRSLFSPVWDNLQGAVLSGQIQLLISEHIHNEVYEQAQFFRYDPAPLNEFIDLFNIKPVQHALYAKDLADTSKELAKVTPLKPPTIAKDSHDLSNICVAKLYNATVITAEQGSKIAITDPKYNRLKIPDTCQYYKVNCENWLAVFNFVGLKI